MSQLLVSLFTHLMAMDNKGACLWILQVMSHAVAAQSASVIFVCIHRENYDFLETFAPQLKGKVLYLTVRCLCLAYLNL